MASPRRMSPTARIKTRNETRNKCQRGKKSGFSQQIYSNDFTMFRYLISMENLDIFQLVIRLRRFGRKNLTYFAY